VYCCCRTQKGAPEGSLTRLELSAVAEHTSQRYWIIVWDTITLLTLPQHTSKQTQHTREATEISLHQNSREGTANISVLSVRTSAGREDTAAFLIQQHPNKTEEQPQQLQHLHRTTLVTASSYYKTRHRLPLLTGPVETYHPPGYGTSNPTNSKER
jgi:hypothetical protein